MKRIEKIWREIKRPFRQLKHVIVDDLVSKAELIGLSNELKAGLIQAEHNIVQSVQQELRQTSAQKTENSIPIKSYCPICQHGSAQPFSDFRGRTNAICNNCGSLERHRFLWLAFTTLTNGTSVSDCSCLHFAPEPCFQQHFQTLFGDNYYTGDIQPGRAKYEVDITNICFSENKFDYIVCSHVLEHVIEDITALKELYRVLKVGGLAFLSVPMRDGNTYEDYNITSPEEREKHFKQYDHVRHYGRDDFADRVKSVGFHVEKISPNNIIRHEGLLRLFGIARKAASKYIVAASRTQ